MKKQCNITTILLILIGCFIIIPLCINLFKINIFEGLECDTKCIGCDGVNISNYITELTSKIDALMTTGSTKCSDISNSIDISNCNGKSIDCPVPADTIKCIADFGTSVGDPLCCGQDGVLQDTRYVCPNTLQKCSNFKCGSAFGTCTK